MAVLAASASAVHLVRDQARDNMADRLLGLRSQIGDVWACDSGVVVETRTGWELVTIDVDLDTWDDGQVYGPVDNRLTTSASAPFTPAMLGTQIRITGHGTRVITAVNSTSEIEYSGNPIPAATGVRFSLVLGSATFDDGAVDGNVLTCPQAPFAADLVGHNVYLEGIGSRQITVYTSPTEIEFDGLSVAADDKILFIIPLFTTAVDRQLTAGGQVVDSHRTDPTTAPMTMRWRLGDRTARGPQRTVV